MGKNLKERLKRELSELKEEGLYKEERVITTPQGAVINTEGGEEVINFCSNNYLGLSSHPRVLKAAKKTVDEYGYGMSSVRFICGTQTIHKKLEAKLADFLHTDDAILYAACFDANGGIFEPLLGPGDAIISDRLNHASIIDGVRLCKADRYVYAHNDMESLEDKLQEASDAEVKIIATDGVFSMDGTIAQLDKICDLADEYDALVMSDECHATGFIGETGRGVPEYRDVLGRVDIITGTLGKALGGASGGFTAARQEIVDMLRQKSRPYLFSNTLAPSITGASIEVLDLLNETTELRDKLENNTTYFREGMKEAGFDIKEGSHPIVPIMLYDARKAQKYAERLLEKGIYVIGFYYPVVPKGEARIRVQLSAVHEKEHLDQAIEAFTEVKRELA
ncbi:glycine C-acetyltransferase [Aliifodinibius salicampi]|uniref:2-amino-3-ketobutyrate coenzyme A ligase n=1 Tax=Fodinibius salicampi TaxID=1920655 RepID=A0ABT3PZV2_9BACT|nr:glycine C-acetyltransferase [Fodinibius salicampi]MCW9713367.1 glycine C-acetyltransferase [Fodinibius salicampi]